MKMPTKTPPPREARDATTPARGNQREPRLPHERDQSSDPQAAVNDETKRIGEQAARDLARGLVDTDRGPVVESLSAQHFSSAAKRAARSKR